MTRPAKPILFSPAMVRAVRDKQKTQTRRLITSPLSKLEAGDRLYVRESFRTVQTLDAIAPRDFDPTWKVFFEADKGAEIPQVPLGRLRAAMHLPKAFSRIILHVEDVKFQRLQSISHADMIAEGILHCSPEIHHLQTAWQTLWDSLHGDKPGEAWADDPQIVAVRFRAEFPQTQEA